MDVVLAPQAITSADVATATVGSPFSFTVTTTGVPLPPITKTGKLPKHLTLVKKHNGTALISGTPTKTGTSTFTIKADFGAGNTGHIVTQSFTLTVDPPP